ncbi:MAG: KilA-N domain-containing protein, partial [Bacteroidota bacterium]
MSEKLHIEGQEISIKTVNDQDYISLTDIAKQNRPDQSAGNVVKNWLGSKSTILFIEEWELNFNLGFNVAGFRYIEKEGLKNSPSITPKQLKEKANCIGIYSELGRYGGIYGHVDLAFEFTMWIEPKFKVKLIIDYKRLRSEEAKRQRLEWNAGRELARLNYPIQTAAIKEVSQSLPDKK